MDQAGIVCYFCFAGVFMHRSFWQFARCPSCKGTDFFCVDCCGRAYVSTPRDDIDVDELRRCWESVVARHTATGEDLPAPVAVLKP
ncbi:hypothetical protein BJD11_00635 (plasmid) [Xanthomonas euvesicatoria]|nr:hypothetical protein BJD11_00635 [Xanthomonas euvesicatoria]